MTFLDRLKQFWSSSPPPDHPLSEEERLEQERHPHAAYDESARQIDDYADGDQV